MKKIILLCSLCFFSVDSYAAGILKFGILIGGVLSGEKAYNNYQIEKEKPANPNLSLEIAKKAKDKVLSLVEIFEDNKKKNFSKFINHYGKNAEEFEDKYPKATKYGVLAAILLILAFFM